MGEIADMMINGLMCEGCGEFLDGNEPGYARYCSEQCAKNRGVEYNESDDDYEDDDEEPSIEGICDAMNGAITWIEMAIDDLKALKIKGHIKELSWLVKRMEQFKQKIKE